MPSLTKNYHVIAPDMLASNFLRLNPRTYSVDSEVRLVLNLMRRLKIKKSNFVGISVGGWVSLLIALEHPERVQKMVLAESAGLTTKIPELAKLTLTDRAKAKQFLKLLFYKPPPLPNFVIDQLIKSSKKIKKNYEAVFAGFIKNSKNRVLDNKLKEISQKTLILHGREDQVIPLEHAKRLQKGLVNSKLIILEESGHAVVWDSAKKLKEELNKFLVIEQ